MKDTSGGLRKGREKNFLSSVVSFVSALQLVFWKVSLGEINRFVHQEMAKVKERRKTENNIFGVKWKDITLGEFMVFFGILLQMCLSPLPGHSSVCIGRMVLSCFLLSTKFNCGVYNKSEVYSTSTTMKQYPSMMMPCTKYARLSTS
jgi:hypothetical protein